MNKLRDEKLRPIYVEAFNKAMQDTNTIADAGLVALRAVAESAMGDSAKDAERYRWLRANWTTMRSSSTDTTLKLTSGTEPWADFGPDVIDAAIDTAMLSASEQLK